MHKKKSKIISFLLVLFTNVENPKTNTSFRNYLFWAENALRFNGFLITILIYNLGQIWLKYMIFIPISSSFIAGGGDN